MFLKGKFHKGMLAAAGIMTVFGSATLFPSQLAWAETAKKPATTQKIATGDEKLSPVSAAIQKRLSSRFRKISRSKKWSRGALVQFYADSAYEPIWVTKQGLDNRATSLLKVIDRSGEYGLVPKEYRTSLARSLGTGGDTLSPAMLARAELELSLAALKYMNTARNGRLQPAKLSRFLEGTFEKIDGVRALENLAARSMVRGYLESYHPRHPQYAALKKQLAIYRGASSKQKEIVRIPAAGPSLREGMVHPDVALVRKRLNVKAVENNDGETFNPELYDAAMVKAVAGFQESKGLKGDGIAGQNTRLAMNEGSIPRKWRTQQILANMEKWRWLPDNLGQKHIRINIPEYIVRVTVDSETIHKERVIVGKVANKTPSFSDRMETVVFNPYWNVPQSIIANEMNHSVPRGYEGHYSKGLLHVRQPPGPGNALGLVKFLFPNKHAVYLHDTPTKHLFKQKVRAFSHGCMRVRDPKRMAEVILGIAHKGSSQEIVKANWGSLRNKHFALNEKIPVHVTYLTAWAKKDGSVKFFNDVYKHDNRIVTALNGGQVSLEPKQKIKKKKFYDSGDYWGYGFESNRNQNRGGGFWESSPQASRRRNRRNTRFDPFGLGW